MSRFKKGQLVAVKVYSDENWEPAIFERKEGIFCICRSLLNKDAWLRRPWSKARPAEEVWPGIFLFSDRLIIESCQEKDLAYVKTIENLCRRLVWLSEQLQVIGDRNGTQECPPSPYHDCRIGSCADCWEQASLEATKEEGDVR